MNVTSCRHAALLALLLGPLAQPADAVEFIVSSRNDTGAGTLRQAILDANATPGQETITITATGVIALQSPLPILTGNTLINGPGTNRLVVSGGGVHRILSVAAGSTNSLRGLTLADGHAGAGVHGAAISNAGKLTLQEVVITNCHALGALGGAVYNHAGAVLHGVTSLFVANSVRGADAGSLGADGSGGGGGGGAGLGGAVYNAGEFHFSACEFSCNSAFGGNGGAGGGAGTNYPGAQGGGPNGGLGGGEDFAGAAATGPGGGGGGGGGTDFGTQDHGGAGGFGGGGGGAGARRFDGSGGVGGVPGRFGGRGGSSCCLQAGGGGGGAGLGGAIFTASGGQGTLLACRFVRNLAWHGLGGPGAPGAGEGSDGAGAGGAVFSEDNAGLLLESDPVTVFSGNAASTAFPDAVAGVVTVTTNADAGPGSLRQAIADVSAAAVPAAILVDITNVISLAAPLAVTSGEVLILGAATDPDALRLSGGNTRPVFEIGPGASLALRAVTIANGRATNGGGAGLRNEGGMLLLEDCVVRDNHAVGAIGGGVFNSGTFTARRSTFTGNSARGQRGYDFMYGDRSGCGGGGGGGGGLGGGIFSEGSMELVRCVVTGNTAAGGDGGFGGESGFDEGGGMGGGPNGGAGGSGYRMPGVRGGFGGGGGGGGGGADAELSPGADGGTGGFGGGGGGGGASYLGGFGGNGGQSVFGGNGGRGQFAFGAGGGGGAGLGGGIFVRNGEVFLQSCMVTNNTATNGYGGFGGALLLNPGTTNFAFLPNAAPGTNGAGVAGGLFDLARTVTLEETIVTGNHASSSNANTFTAPGYGAALEEPQNFVINPGVGTNATFIARPTGLGPFTYQWFFNGELVGTEQSLVLSNVTPAQVGVYHLIITTPIGTTFQFTAQLGVRYTGGLDAARPSLVLSAPAALSTRVSSNELQLAGTARDASGIAGVVIETVSPAGAPPRLATGTTNWNALVPLVPGTNVFSVIAFDRAGNESLPQRRTVYYAVSNRLKLAVSGQGTVLPSLHNQSLELGRGYTLRATPAAGAIFSHWSGGEFPSAQRLSESNALTFLMSPDLVLEAHFVPNPFPARSGAYNGLFAEADEARLERSGAVTLTLTSQGTFTAALRTAGKRYAFSGRCNADGLATNVVLRPGTNALTVELQLHLDDSGRLAGRVTDGAWSAMLWAERAVFHAVTNRATNFLGDYTLALVTGESLTEAVGAVNVSAAGVAKFTGSLFDTPALTQQVPLSREGAWPFFAPLYGGRGQLLGRLQVGRFGVDSITGGVAWVKTALPATLAASRLAPPTFTNALAAFGSTYLKPTTNRVLNFSQGTAAFTGGELGASFANTVALSTGNVVTNLSPNALSLVIAKPTGLFSGKVTAPGTNRMATFKGAILQQRGYGTGFFAGTNGVGQVTFGPVAP